ncbi:MAG TPA: hypothetical protein VMA77_05185 [Solirubrobacteraceae bacterium]|nr:hypothetical protein [Solirubrobacteraceae bacterium]
MSSADPENNLTPSELENLDRLEAAAQREWAAYLAVGSTLAEIRDRQLFRETHASFEDYLRQRWGLNGARESLAKACEQTLSALGGGEAVAVEIRVTISKRDSAKLSDASVPRQPPVARLVDDDVLPKLRLLLAQASGTVADVAHHLETRAADIDARALAKLRDDVVVLDDELTTVKALLVGPIDWNSELEWLLSGELPPFEDDGDSHSAEEE